MIVNRKLGGIRGTFLKIPATGILRNVPLIPLIKKGGKRN